ncbi:hypothetical protein FIBSPDRAFT_1050693 [Athelia psychrophila]|uniref:NACHT domain-containing protein n=1 Tax=Athelia psychrophila TaxID=1759441 RepID=A0A166AFB3_9AGAM|nr:hypothetical protein FIBSPDRAFT_1050693 [Fibularhizoctonia sp. CBS 109695]
MYYCRTDPALACFPGTRVAILSLIDGWARSRDGQNVLWLNGVAGSGKSAIAHTVAQTLHKDRVLVSSFFVDVTVDSRKSLRSIFSTVARDIAARYPAFAEDISAILEEDLSLASAPLGRQFEELIKKPLLRHAISDPIVVVIDALDERIQDASYTELLRILRDEVSELPPQLRILVSSRPTRELVDFLSRPDHIQSHVIDITSRENADHIEAFISQKLQDGTLRDKLGLSLTDSVTLSDLKLLADGLFIWIVAVFRYLDSVDNPEGELRSLLSNADRPGRLSRTKQIDALYAAILEVPGDLEDPQRFAFFMGTIMAAKRPLSLAALSALHGDAQKRIARIFGSVLVGLLGKNEPIRTLHPSFQEFFTDHANNAQDTCRFYISEKMHSQRLAVLCVQTMVRECKTAPIIGTGYLARGCLDPPGIPEVVGVSEQLLYSCESWIDHLVDIKDPDSTIKDGLQALLSQYSTMWMEIVASRSIFRGSVMAWQWLEDHSLQLTGLPDYASRADILFTLSYRLSSVGRHEEAVTAGREAVDLRRTLAADQPAVFNGPLADSLFSMTIRLAAAGRHEQAITTVREVIDRLRTLVVNQPAVFQRPLADSVNNLAVLLAAVGRHDEAVIREAVDLRRALAAD